MTAPGAAPELTVLGEIAAGGMGTVELARMVDASGESLVAVKRMHREHASDPEFVRMFRDEIWLMGALRHPNLVPLIGWGEDEAGPYLVMQYIDGVALGRIAGVGRRALQPIREHLVAYVAARAAEGLHAAHQLRDERGRPLEIVHRDVTPSNVLVAFDGGVLVTDFGIAKAAGKSSHTRTGIIKGKIAYMSPEYSVRKPVDGRADLYSLGVVMYELLTGELPFEARTDFELLKKVAYSQAPRLITIAPEVDERLAAIVDRLLAKEPSARPADGAELAKELDSWSSDSGYQAEEVRRELAAYAEKHAGEKHKRVKQLLDPEADTVPDDGSGPKRPKFITLGTRTFTLFDPSAPTLAEKGSHPKSSPRASRPEVTPEHGSSTPARGSHPDVTPSREARASRPEEERPRTRRVAVSDFPPPSAPFASPITPPPQSAPSVSAVVTEARESRPPPSPEASQRLSAVRASVPPGAGLTPVVATRAIRAHSSALLSGVVAGSVVALLLVVVAVVVALGRRSETPPVSAQEPSPPMSEVPAAPPLSALPALSVAPEPVVSPPSPELPSASPAPSTRPPRPPPTGKPPRLPTKVSKPPKGKTPCTPSSFDYPACLSG